MKNASPVVCVSVELSYHNISTKREDDGEQSA